MNDVTNLADTIKPKSDQLNADDLLTGSITVTVVDVVRGSKDQPIAICINGQQPYKPCKSMRRALIMLWGDNGKKWIGRSMTLFCDPTVKWAGVAIGGIRISHVSDITEPKHLMLTATRGRKSEVVINPLATIDHSEIIAKYKSTPDGEEKNALWSTLSNEQQIAINKEFE